MDPKVETVNDTIKAIQAAAVAHCGEPYEVDQENIDVVITVAHWVARVPRADLDLDKGIALLGNVGTGKTLLMKCVRDVMMRDRGHGFGLVSCPKLVRDFNPKDSGGWEGIQNWVNGPRVCYDELGRETEAIHMGLRTKLLPEIIESRYERMYDARNPLVTHLISNMDVPALQDHLGPRGWSRVRHMCNILVLGGLKTSKDRRIKAKAIVHKEAPPQRENIYTAMHPDLVRRLREAGIGAGTRQLATRPAHQSHSREGDLHWLAGMLQTLDNGELAAFEETVRKQNDSTTAAPYLRIFAVERERRNTVAQ